MRMSLRVSSGRLRRRIGPVHLIPSRLKNDPAQIPLRPFEMTERQEKPYVAPALLVLRRGSLPSGKNGNKAAVQPFFIRPYGVVSSAESRSPRCFVCITCDGGVFHTPGAIENSACATLRDIASITQGSQPRSPGQITITLTVLIHSLTALGCGFTVLGRHGGANDQIRLLPQALSIPAAGRRSRAHSATTDGSVRAQRRARRARGNDHGEGLRRVPCHH
jgi:hypothetical protein